AVEIAFLRNLPRRLNEGMHGDARERAAHADPADAKVGEVADRVAERRAVQEIDRLRRDGLDGCRDLFAGLDAWRIKTIGPGIGECLQSADGLVEIGSVPDETFGARGEDNTTARLVDRIARCANALDRQIAGKQLRVLSLRMIHT